MGSTLNGPAAKVIHFDRLGNNNSNSNYLVADKLGSTLNGAAAKVTNFDRFGEKVRPGTFWKMNLGFYGSTQKAPLSKHTKFAVTPLALTPSVPFRGAAVGGVYALCHGARGLSALAVCYRSVAAKKNNIHT